MPEDPVRSHARIRILDRRLLGLAARAPRSLFFTILFGLSTGWLVVVQAGLISRAVSAAFLEHSGFSDVQRWLWPLLAIIAARGLVASLGENSASVVALRVKSWLRARLMRNICQLGPVYTRQERSGELGAAAAQGIDAIEPYFAHFLPQLVIALAVPGSILLAVFPRDSLSGFILLLTAPLIPIFMYMIGGSAQDLTRRQYGSLGRLSAHFLDSLQGLTTLKIFGQARTQVRNIARVAEEFRLATFRVLRTAFMSAFALELLATISTAIIAVEVALRLLAGRMDFERALFILVLAPEFYLPLRLLGQRFHAAVAGTTAADRTFSILHEPANHRQHSRPAGQRGSRVVGVRLERVCYAYPDSAVNALHDIDLDLRRGEHLALVGPSGAGKSTLAGVLLGFMAPASGSLTVQYDDGTSTSEAPQAGCVAWMPQRPFLFHDTIAANLRLANARATQAELESAAQAARLHDFIRSLPDGYETVIGEAGARLSSGEAQRLAFARALLSEASIIVLDEPTSSLDPQTESLLEDAAHAIGDRTVVTIAHRLNTVRRADRILVLDQGRIVESGTHAELVLRGGVYARMLVAQSAGMGVQAADEGRESVAALTPAAAPPLTDSLASFITSGMTTPSSSGGVFGRLLSFLRGSLGWVVLAVVLGSLTIGSSVALMGTSAWLISAAALQPPLGKLSLAIVGVRFFGIARAVFRYLERLVSHNVTFRLLGRLRTWFFSRLEPLAPARLAEHRAGDVLSRFVADVETLQDFYVRVIAPPGVAALVLAGTSWYLATHAAVLALAAAAVFMLFGALLPAVMRQLGRRLGEDVITRRAHLQVHVVESIQGLPEILAFGRGEDRLRQSEAVGRAYEDAQRRLGAVGAMQAGLAVFLQHLGLWSILVLAVPLVAGGAIPGVMLAALALLTAASLEAALPLPLAGQMWAATRLAAARLFEIVDAPPAVADHPAGAGVITSSSRALPSIEFDHVSFTYPGSRTPALHDITFDLGPGRSLAIVGPTGAGKSTLLALLLRFWEPSSGAIRLDGAPLNMYLQDEVRARIGMVWPGAYFFNASILENIRLARAHASRRDVEQAATRAGLHDLILGFPDGYDTLIGEAGVRLSAGERQRLSIARLILKDAPIMLLDEPTANLDAVTERNILAVVFDLMRTKTAILVTHRLIGLENAHEVLVLDDGHVVQRGTHEQLMAAQGLYRRLREIQDGLLA